MRLFCSLGRKMLTSPAKGADDDVSLCVSTGSLASSWQKVRITIRYLHMSSDLPSLDDKGADDDVSLYVSTGSVASSWQKVRITIRYFRMSSDLPSLDDKGANDDVSHCVSMDSLASSWQKVQITIRYLRVSSDLPSLDDKGADEDVSHCMLLDPWAWRIENETCLQSRPEDADISRKGAYDNVSLCVSMGLLASSWKKVQITIRYLRISSDMLSQDDKGADDDVSLCVSTDSLASSWKKVRITIRYLRMLSDLSSLMTKVQMMMLVTACQRARLPLADKRCR